MSSLSYVSHFQVCQFRHSFLPSVQLNVRSEKFSCPCVIDMLKIAQPRWTCMLKWIRFSVL
jgi:hypothetical protein